MKTVEGSVHQFVNNVVARCDESHRQYPDGDPHEKSKGQGVPIKAQRDDNARQNEYILHPMIKACDLDVTLDQRGKRGASLSIHLEPILMASSVPTSAK